MAAMSTKQKMLSLIEDVEIVSRELFELMSTPKGQLRQDAPEPEELIQLLIKKDKNIKEQLKIAAQQAEVQKTIDELKTEVDRRDLEIKLLQKNLKEAETVLSQAIYQAKQKLTSINQANQRKISSEELIKFAHRISASNAVASPPTWAPGDPRRPYPTDFEMRSGCLAKLNDFPSNSQTPQAQGTYGEPVQSSRAMQMSDHHTLQTQSSQSSTGSTTWQAPPDFPIPHSAGTPGHHPVTDIKGHSKDTEEVELMSSDSSSSSSSDE